MNSFKKRNTHFRTQISETKQLLPLCKVYYKIEILKEGSASYLIRSITNFMFDEVFPLMEYSKTTILLNQCIKLLPPEAIPKHRHYSSEHIILGFVGSEIRFPGICIKAAELFVNYDHPDVSVKVLNFLKTNISDHCILTKMITPAGSFDPNSISDVDKRESASINSTQLAFNCQADRKILTWIWSIVLVTLLVIGICMGLYMFVRIRSIESNISTVSVETNFSRPHKLSPSNVPTKSNWSLVRLKRVLNVTSLFDLQSNMRNIHHDEDVTVNLFLNVSLAWEQYEVIENAHTITQITMEGSLHTNVLLKILRDCKNIQHVTIVNTNDLLCQDNIYSSSNFKKSVELPNVQSLKLYGFSECLYVYNILANNMIFNNLKHVHIVNGKITESNLIFIQKLFTNPRFYLTHINLESCRILTAIINNNLNTLPEVKYLRVDFSDNQISNIDTIGTTFSHIFPKLETFQSLSGYLSWNEVLNLSYCKHLKHLSMGIKVLSGKSYFNLRDLHLRFESLRELEVIFKFEGINVYNGCTYEGENELKQHLRTLKFESNCLPIKRIDQY